ncbi:hypothetical protein [Ralstonia sp. NFACC01]|jgi:hypothetical protein|uniref:hypothetical protein n=1 Tax=Ralstonia sp. NFACC01 TaxID=1566294 RepID=UPI0008F054A7|nr:hypothetical protein [Ralstonia sp. NFACC01]SFP98305.1 hypothetical protein SAMN03159417_03874 [Ralstonia sp. NFACC01]
MDTLSNSPSRRQPIRWYGALVALLLITGGLCLMLGQSQNIRWLEQLDWHLNYDTAGVALLWLGALLMLPQLAYSFWLSRGPNAHGGWHKRAGAAIAVLIALVLLAVAPDNLMIKKYHLQDTAAMSEGEPTAGGTRTSLYAFQGFRPIPGFYRQHEVDTAPNRSIEGRPSRTIWRGTHNVVFGTIDTYETYAADEAQTTSNAGSHGYECLVRTVRYFGPFVGLFTVNIRNAAEASKQPECKPIALSR